MKQELEITKKVEFNITDKREAEPLILKGNVENYIKHLDEEAKEFLCVQLLCHEETKQHILKMVEEWNGLYRFKG